MRTSNPIFLGTMTQTIRVLLPNVPIEELICFKGVANQETEDIIIYITEFANSYESLLSNRRFKDEVILGQYVQENIISENRIDYFKHKNVIVLENQNNTICVLNLVLNGKNMLDTENFIIIKYDYEKFKKSETIDISTDYFFKLQSLLKVDSETQLSLYTPSFQIYSLLSMSMFAQHLNNYFNLLHWLIKTVKKEKRISLKPGNFILAIITDIVLGYLIMHLIMTDDNILGLKLMGVIEKMVNLLHSLLKWLMGAPAGLKLNNAFNKMLGNYFSYNIQVWYLFLEMSGEKLHLILNAFHYLGYLGFSIQAAIITDLICLVTVHSYCIYAYAARLFNIQISGLIALLRLFVGRKYNPLRKTVDSCEYTNQELFVGTVAFTIVLLLLPTTAMYYIVFTLFRLLSIGVQYVLAKLIYTIQTLPLYVVGLWLIKSPKVAGNITLQMENNEEGKPLVLRAKLLTKSVQELVILFKPPVEVPKHFKWQVALSNICRGQFI